MQICVFFLCRFVVLDDKATTTLPNYHEGIPYHTIPYIYYVYIP